VRERLDALLVRRGLVGSRTQARDAVLAGRITVDGRPALKPGSLVVVDARVELLEQQRFVSRGGEKLDHAMEVLGVEVAGEDVCDLGSSTGGFVDRLLQGGARAVAAIDVGYGQLDWRLRNDPRVTVLERTNARFLTCERLPFRPSFVTADLSFISLTVALGAVLECARAGYRGLVLVKPQFEAGREHVGKGGVVRDREVHRGVLLRVGMWLEEHGAAVLGMCDSGHPGPKGNVEYFAYFCDAASVLAASRVSPELAASAALEGVRG
jgi:23S rRNA (cytidine1920-2'-O)/16S rRNA (cytidine1409-2'-O)-methyltransferase